VDPLIAPELAADLRGQLLALLPTGRRFPVPASELASHLGVSERTVGGLVADLIELDDRLIGSVCSGDRPGYFLVADLEDLETGTAHLVSRARRINLRVAKMRRLARSRFSEAEVLQLFALEPASSSGSSADTGPSTAAPTPGIRAESAGAVALTAAPHPAEARVPSTSP
jgi:hypothetical protein